MKFSLGDSVEVVKDGQRATVVSCEYKRLIDKSNDYEVERYLIKVEDEAFAKFRSVEELKPWLEIDQEAEQAINKLLIDIHLDCGNVAAVCDLVKGDVE